MKKKSPAAKEAAAPFWTAYVSAKSVQETPEDKEAVAFRAIELAMLAALYKPGMTPMGAVLAASELLDAAEEETASRLAMKRILTATVKDERDGRVISDFEKEVVPLITGVRRPERAMPWFRKFIKAHRFSDAECARQMRLAREHITPAGVYALKVAYAEWKADRRKFRPRLLTAKT